jgi:hypothetical protein
LNFIFSSSIREGVEVCGTGAGDDSIFGLRWEIGGGKLKSETSTVFGCFYLQLNPENRFLKPYNITSI